MKKEMKAKNKQNKRKCGKKTHKIFSNFKDKNKRMKG